MSKLKIHTGLTSIAVMLMAGSAFAEPPIQPGDTLESLSKVKIEMTVNGQPGSLEQMGISKDVIAQAISQNAIIDLQTGTLHSAHAMQQPLMSQPPTLSSSSSQTLTQDINAQPPMQQQSVVAVENTTTPDIDAAEHSAKQQAERHLAQEHALQTSATSSSFDELESTTDMTTPAQAEEINAAVDAAITTPEADAAAVMPEALNNVDPNVQALPAESNQMNETQQLGDTEIDGTSPLQ